jgi:site-specific DNA-adenine methylase
MTSCTFDPPYLDNCDVRAYTADMLDHREMVELLKAAKFRWLLSEYKHPLYLKAFGKPTLEIEKQKIIKSNSAGRGKVSHRAVECLWRSF